MATLVIHVHANNKKAKGTFDVSEVSREQLFKWVKETNWKESSGIISNRHWDEDKIRAAVGKIIAKTEGDGGYFRAERCTAGDSTPYTTTLRIDGLDNVHIDVLARGGDIKVA